MENGCSLSVEAMRGPPSLSLVTSTSKPAFSSASTMRPMREPVIRPSATAASTEPGLLYSAYGSSAIAGAKPPETSKAAQRSPILAFLMTSAPFHFRVERIAEAVPDQIDGQHHHQDSQARECYHPPGAQDELAGIGQHRTP